MIQEIFSPPEGESVAGTTFEDLCTETLTVLDESDQFRWTGQELESSDSRGCRLSIRERGGEGSLRYKLVVDPETPSVVYVVE